MNEDADTHTTCSYLQFTMAWTKDIQLPSVTYETELSHITAVISALHKGYRWIGGREPHLILWIHAEGVQTLLEYPLIWIYWNTKKDMNKSICILFPESLSLVELEHSGLQFHPRFLPCYLCGFFFALPPPTFFCPTPPSQFFLLITVPGFLLWSCFYAGLSLWVPIWRQVTNKTQMLE